MYACGDSLGPSDSGVAFTGFGSHILFSNSNSILWKQSTGTPVRYQLCCPPNGRVGRGTEITEAVYTTSQLKLIESVKLLSRLSWVVQRTERNFVFAREREVAEIIPI
jgi:hypothetical protein